MNFLVDFNFLSTRPSIHSFSSLSTLSVRVCMLLTLNLKFMCTASAWVLFFFFFGGGLYCRDPSSNPTQSSYLFSFSSILLSQCNWITRAFDFIPFCYCYFFSLISMVNKMRYWWLGIDHGIWKWVLQFCLGSVWLLTLNLIFQIDEEINLDWSLEFRMDNPNFWLPIYWQMWREFGRSSMQTTFNWTRKSNIWRWHRTLNNNNNIDHKKKVEGFVLRRKEKDVPPLKTKWTSRLIRSWSFFFECSHRRTLVPSSVSPSQIWQAVAMATLVLCFQATYSQLAPPPPSWLFLFETLDIFLELTGALKRQQLAVSTYALGNWTPETSHSIKYRFRVLHRLTHLSIDWIRPKYE